MRDAADMIERLTNDLVAAQIERAAVRVTERALRGELDRMDDVSRAAEVQRLRAELAVAKLERDTQQALKLDLRAELAARSGCETCDGERQFNRAQKAEEAIERVEELCAEAERGWHHPKDTALVRSADVRAAIDWKART